MKNVLIASFSAVGLFALAAPAQAARIVFTAPSAQAVTVPSTGSGQGGLNGSAILSTTGGTGIFSGATGWLNANESADLQSFSWRATGNPDAVAGTRSVDIRFNRFTLTGSCAICGVSLLTSTDSVGGGYSNEGLGIGTATNTGVTLGATIRAGSLYGGAPITFAIPGLDGQVGNVSFESISNGGYTITLDVPDAPDVVPAPLPLLGGASAFAFSRRLRRRIRLAEAAA